MDITLNELKSMALQLGLPKILNQKHKAFMLEKDPIKARELYYDYIFTTIEYQPYSSELLIVSERINDAYYKRLSRVKNRINGMMFCGTCCFLTLTFNDDVLARTSEQTRRTYVQRYFKGFECPYMFNVDYGSLNGREHYHGIIMCDKSTIDSDVWEYGFQNTKQIYNTRSDMERVSRYINKLTNHAIKETTKNKRISYSQHIDDYIRDYYIENLMSYYELNY